MPATPSLTQEEEWKLFVKAICVLIAWVATELPSADQRQGVNVAEANTTLACVPLSPSHSEADIDVFHMAIIQCDYTRFWDVEQVGT